MKTFTATTLLAAAMALVATATPLNKAYPSHGAGAHYHGGHEINHHNHTINGTSTIRTTITKTHTSTIYAEPTQYNDTADATSDIAAQYTPAYVPSMESGDAEQAAATGLW